MAEAKRDKNYVPSLLAVSNADGTTPVVLWADPSTHRLLTDTNGALSSTSGQYKSFYTVGTANADYITTGTNDDVQIQAAIDAANSAGGGTVFLKTGAYSVSSPINLNSNITLMGSSRTGAVITASLGSLAAYQAVLNISNKNRVTIRDIGLITNGASPGITSLGHDGLTIMGCRFTGSTTTGGGVIVLNGQNGTAPFVNTKIQNNEFSGMSGINRTIYLYSRNGNTISATIITHNTFATQTGPCINLDDYDVLEGTIVSHNTFKDINAGVGITGPGVAVFAGLAGLNLYIHNTVVTNNYYKNTLTSNAQQGFVYVYSAQDTVISNNTIIGAWTPSTLTVGPCIAPGRTSTPLQGLSITGNYIEGFDAPWDPDSMRYVEVGNNVVYRCGGGFSLGYGTQEHVDIHDNVMYNSPATAPYSAGVIFGNSTPLKCSFRNNIIVDDRPIPAPTVGTPSVSSGGTLTASTTFYYKVTSLDAVGETLGSSEVSGLTTGSNKTITLNWNPVSGATSYKVYRTTSSGTYGATSLAGTNTNCTFTDNGLTLTTGTVPGSSTVATTTMANGIKLTGNYNFSDVKVTGNRFYRSGGTLTALFAKELGSETVPAMVSDNEINGSGGKVIDLDGIYAMLAGRTGGQTLTGDTASGGNLTVKSTSHATKGKILFGTSAYDEANNRLGVGTASPSTALQVVGDITATTVNTFTLGIGAGAVSSNLVLGSGAFAANTIGDSNTAIGYQSLKANTNGYQNTALGFGTLQASVSGRYNVAIGSYALGNNTTDNNIAIGTNALNVNVSGDSNTAVGGSTLQNTTSYGNTALGNSAGNSLTSGHGNLFLGRDAGNSGSQKVDAVNSVALGTSAYTTADNQVVIGGSGVTQTLLQRGVGIGGAPATSAALEVASTTGAILFPRMTTTQKNALTAVNGMVIYDSSLDKLQAYQAGSWQNLI